MTTPMDQLQQSAQRIIGGQLAQREHARKVAADIAAAAAQAAPASQAAGTEPASQAS